STPHHLLYLPTRRSSDLCCLKNEQETYEELNKKLPSVGDMVTTPDGLQGNVQSVNVLRQMVKIVVDVNDEKEIQEYKASELKFRDRKSTRLNSSHVSISY